MIVRRLGVAMSVGAAMIVFPASASAAPPPGPPPPWPSLPQGTSAPAQTPPTTPPVAAPQAPAASPTTTQTQNTPPKLRVSCKRHSDHRWSCTVRTTDSNKPVARCSGRGRVTASRRAACRAKALRSLGFAAKAKAAQVNATWGPPFLVCPQGEEMPGDRNQQGSHGHLHHYWSAHAAQGHIARWLGGLRQSGPVVGRQQVEQLVQH